MRTSPVNSSPQDGVERLVNLVTPSTNVIVLLNAQSPANYQFFAYSLFSYLASPGVMSDTLLLDPQLGAWVNGWCWTHNWVR